MLQDQMSALTPVCSSLITYAVYMSRKAALKRTCSARIAFVCIDIGGRLLEQIGYPHGK